MPQSEEIATVVAFSHATVLMALFNGDLRDFVDGTAAVIFVP